MTELGLNLPLYALAGVQLLVALLLLAPKPVSRLAASLYKSTDKNLVVKTVLYTTAAGLSAIAAASLYQAYDIAGDIRTTSGQRHEPHMIAHFSPCGDTCVVQLVDHAMRCFAQLLANVEIQLRGFQRSVGDSLVGDRRALVLEVDTHRAQVSIVLAVANILMMFLNKALALEQLQHDSAVLNLNTMKKQVRSPAHYS